VYPIPDPLIPTEKNRLNSYLPIRKKGNDFDWASITGTVLGNAMRREVSDYSIEEFRADCKANIKSRLDEPSFWEVLDNMYFLSNAIFDVSPMFLLFKAQPLGGKNTLGAANQRMSDLFANLMGESYVLGKIHDSLNFVESEMMTTLQAKLKASSALLSNEQTYLPYLADAFRADITFLATRPKYLMDEVTNVLKLYAFSYCSQLALNVAAWRDGEPTSKPLFFILDTETASAERTQINMFGHRLFAGAAERLFPILSALEPLQFADSKRPLWQVFLEAKQHEGSDRVLEALNIYLKAFAETKSRRLPVKPSATSIEQAFEYLIDLAIQQFRDEKTERPGVNRAYVRELERQVCDDFVQFRGRAGRVLVLNQDRLLLLTNLAVGRNEKLRLHELLHAFQQRGFYFDGQSQQVLISFYERMGNIERMSDSGDAVYVRKTV
jgi:DNA phosphorothioation-dependent restriction protein DptG